MLEHLYGIARLTHIVMGTFCALSFWAQLFTKKGGRVHIRIGVVYVFTLSVMLLTACSASLLLITDPTVDPRLRDSDPGSTRTVQSFLLWGSILTGVTGWQGLRALRLKAKGSQLDPRGVLARIHVLCLAAVVPLFALSAYYQRYVFCVIAVVLIPAVIANLRAARRPWTGRRDWYYEHTRALLMTGVFTQAVFMMVVLTRFVAPFGYWAVILLWCLPFPVGQFIVSRAVLYYRRKETPAPQKAPAQLA